MKTLLSIAILIASQFANANMDGTFTVAANFKIQHYTNEMPQVIIDDRFPVGARDVWSVLATVEFCATVSEEQFELRVDVAPQGNFLRLVADIGMIDCMGPTRIQYLRYAMPKDADVGLPFYSVMPIEIEYLGPVH